MRSGINIGYETSDYGIEWLRFDEECPLPEIVKTIPHVAFEVDDIREGFPPVESRSLAHVLENIWPKAVALGLGFCLISATSQRPMIPGSARS